MGYKFYDSISSIPDDPPVDLAILAVPAQITPSIIEEIGKKKTVLVIAHRLSTIEHADIVYNLDSKPISLSP